MSKPQGELSLLQKCNCYFGSSYLFLLKCDYYLLINSKYNNIAITMMTRSIVRRYIRRNAMCYLELHTSFHPLYAISLCGFHSVPQLCTASVFSHCVAISLLGQHRLLLLGSQGWLLFHVLYLLLRMAGPSLWTVFLFNFCATHSNSQCCDRHNDKATLHMQSRIKRYRCVCYCADCNVHIVLSFSLLEVLV